MIKMATQTKESLQEDMNAFLDVFEDFSVLAKERKIYAIEDRVALFGIFINGVLS